MTRRTIGLGILALWLIGLALLYRRSTFRSPEQSLAEAGMRVSPATYYYRLEQGAPQVGAFSSSIDTTTALLVATDFVRTAIPAGNDTLKIQARSQARFSRALSLQDFIVKAEGDLTPFLLRGVVHGEGKARTLQVTTEIPKRRAATTEYEIAGLVFMPTVAPIPLMLGKSPKIGEMLAVGIYDPISRSLRSVNLKIEKDSVFVLADSAALDSASGRWVKAHETTIRGWLVTGDVPTSTAWVDASGRMIAASEPGGLSLIRTTFEIAFENWRLDRSQPDSTATARSDKRPAARSKRR